MLALVYWPLFALVLILAWLWVRWFLFFCKDQVERLGKATNPEVRGGEGVGLRKTLAKTPVLCDLIDLTSVHNCDFAELLYSTSPSSWHRMSKVDILVLFGAFLPLVVLAPACH